MGELTPGSSYSFVPAERSSDIKRVWEYRFCFIEKQADDKTFLNIMKNKKVVLYRL